MNEQRKCNRVGCGKRAAADYPMPVVNGEDRSMVLCREHAEEAIGRGCYVVMFNESESVASQRTDKLLREKHRALTGSDQLRFDEDGNFTGGELKAA